MLPAQSFLGCADRDDGQRLLRPQTRRRAACTEKLWVDDRRTDKHFTLKENPLKRSDVDDLERPASHPLPGACHNSEA